VHPAKTQHEISLAEDGMQMDDVDEHAGLRAPAKTQKSSGNFQWLVHLEEPDSIWTDKPFNLRWKRSRKRLSRASDFEVEVQKPANLHHLKKFDHFMSREGSLLFTPKHLGRFVTPNRFMRSATWEAASDASGIPSPRLKQTIENLAKGGVGLIIPGAVYIAPKARNLPGQTGLFSADHARSWAPVIKSVHSLGSKLVFQAINGGADTRPELNDGKIPFVPTALAPDQREMTQADIDDIIGQFANSAKIAVDAGADGLQLHAAHGYLLSEFLSPAFNHRNDKWGGSIENRVRIVSEIIDTIRKVVPDGFSLSIKLNSTDYVPNGVTVDLASRYVNLLAPKLDFFEISGGTTPKHVVRSDINDEILTRGVKLADRPSLLKSVHALMDGLGFSQMYFREAARFIRKQNPGVALALVGGNREFDRMEEVVASGDADLISMSRPLLRDPYFVMRMRQRTLDKALCVNCGSCDLDTARGVFCHLGNVGDQ
jgi:2,4-dienoyl-CoA reductase-like NADH-dependent reductase (Old Yellow Enzyme family)